MTKKRIELSKDCFVPKNKTDFRGLMKELSLSQLLKIGFKLFCKYDKKDKGTHFLKPGQALVLIPGNLFNVIPENYSVISIFGEKEKFKKKYADDDTRFGCLPYGVIKKL